MRAAGTQGRRPDYLVKCRYSAHDASGLSKALGAFFARSWSLLILKDRSMADEPKKEHPDIAPKRPDIQPDPRPEKPPLDKDGPQKEPPPMQV